MSKLNFNISESSFTLNYSGSSVDIDEKQVVTPIVSDKTDSQSLNHVNSIDSWGKSKQNYKKKKQKKTSSGEEI